MRAARLRFLRVLLAMVCGLPALTTAASADVAWVLWLDLTQISGGKTEEEWTVVSAHPSEEDCQESLKETVALQSRADPGEAVAAQGRHSMSKNPDLGDIFLRYVCLPDTVDPRGPKGK